MTQQLDTATSLSGSDEWSTPPELFAALGALYGPYGIDAAASGWNAKCPIWFGPGSQFGTSALEHDWAGFVEPRVWCNPPYSRGSLGVWVPFMRGLVRDRQIQLVTMLVPHYTAERWWSCVEWPEGEWLGAGWSDSAIGPRTQMRWAGLTVETLRIRGRVKFVEQSGATGQARFSSVAVTFAAPGAVPALVPGRPKGRKRVVTPTVEAMVRRLVDDGHSISRACELGGISRKSWYRHLERRPRATESDSGRHRASG